MSRTSRNSESNAAGRIWNTALYIRLSREDGDKEESDSIGNQRDMLLSYISEHPELKLFDVYVDDGFTGTNFNRPEFQRMIKDMKLRKFDCIIVKDLSRFGRDYIGVGNYQENVFPRSNIRFIALNDRIDTGLPSEESQSILVPFTNIINEQYARDISKKVRSALDTKRKRGEFIGAFASYGYRKDPNDHNRLLVDEEAAENVRKIFRWFLEGMPKLSIALKLNASGVPCPSEYKKQKGMNYHNATRLESTTYWTHTSIHRILKNEIYIGNMVQHTQTSRSFKIKQNIQLKKTDWIIVKGTHEPIIDIQTWETAQRLLQTDIKRSQYTGSVHLFAGVIRCSDCGRAMKKRLNAGGGHEYYICGTYQAYGKTRCSCHSIRTDVLTKMVYEELKAQIGKYADFEKLKAELVTERTAFNRDEIVKRQAGLIKKSERIQKLRRGLYEDYKSKMISGDEYASFKSQYNSELEKIEHAAAAVHEKIKGLDMEREQEKIEKAVLRYTESGELSREMLVSLVQSVMIHEDRSITIHFTFGPGDKPEPCVP